MKKLVTLAALGLVCSLTLAGRVNAAEKVSGNYHYEVLDETSKTAVLTKVDNPGTEVILPSSVDDYTIKQVGKMKKNSYNYILDRPEKIGIFESNDARIIKKLTLPKAVETIGVYALKNCENISKIDLGNHLVQIGPDAFRNCKSLKTVTLPKTLKGIGSAAFACCAGLEKVIFKTDSAKVGLSAFATDNATKKIDKGYIETGSHLKKIQMPFTYKGLLYNGAFSGFVGKTFYWRNFTKYNDGFLSDSRTIEKIVFPKKLKKIYIPQDCISDSYKTLKTMVIPASVKSVYFSQQEKNMSCLTVKGMKTVLEGDFAMSSKHDMISVEKVKCKKNSKVWKSIKKFYCPDFSKKKVKYFELGEYYTRKNVYTKKVVRKKIA